MFSDLDATGKPPSGILVGNLAWLGSYEECTKYVPGAHYCMAFFDTPIQPLTKVRMLSPLIWLPSMFVMELEKYIVTCEWQNHSLVSNKYVSHYLCSIISKSFQMLKITKLKFEELLGWQVFSAIRVQRKSVLQLAIRASCS